MNVNETLDQRGRRYGEYANVSSTSQDLKMIVRGGANYHMLEPEMLESLDLICNKISRVVNGDCNYIDSWHDIAGYAKLVEDKLNKEQGGLS
jgi:hypothetical protein